MESKVEKMLEKMTLEVLSVMANTVAGKLTEVLQGTFQQRLASMNKGT